MRRSLVSAFAAAWLIGATGPATAAPPGDGGTTPIAKAGSERAQRASISRSGLKRRLRQALRSVGGSKGAWAYDVGAPRDPILFSSSGRTKRILASNQKLFTTAAYLHRFGADGRLRTRLYERGSRNPGGGALNGALVLRGDGDPAFGTERFARRHNLPLTPIGALVKEAQASGLKRVDGPLRVDASIFDRRRGVAATGWSAGPYLSPLSGLSFNSGYDGSGYASNPEMVAGRTLKKMLRKRGVRVKGAVRRGKAGDPLLNSEPLGAVRSPAASSLIAKTNKPSNNFLAEMLLKRLAATPKALGTTSRGARKVERFARSEAAGGEAKDGSGLNRGNRASPRQVGRLLVRMGGKRAFRESLAVAGREGTLAGRMRGTAAEGRCRGKTGTLSGVSTLSGYCRAGHKRIVFSILMNGADVYQARLAQDRMAAAIARYRR